MSGEWKGRVDNVESVSDECRAESGDERMGIDGWRVEGGEWTMLSGECRAESGDERMGIGGWRVEGGEWTMLRV